MKVKTPEHRRDIPMIVESPVEEALVTEHEVIPEEIPLPLSPVSEGHSATLAVPETPAPQRRGRGFTDPGKQDKRKSFNPFKRGQSLEPPAPGGSKRISVSASFGNLKRVASTFTRPKSAYDASSLAPSSTSGRAKTFDASYMPSSPRLPSQFNPTPGVGTGVNGESGAELRAPSRRPVGPTLHSRGSIIMEMNAIKDDEVRRMTELAFLG